jgi:hypothetical protein
MAATPESITKLAITRLLMATRIALDAEDRSDDLWWLMPQPGSFGDAGMSDYIIGARGQILFVEAKRECETKEAAHRLLRPAQAQFKARVDAQARTHTSTVTTGTPAKYLVVWSADSFDSLRHRLSLILWGSIATPVPEVAWRPVASRAKRPPPPMRRPAKRDDDGVQPDFFRGLTP